MSKKPSLLRLPLSGVRNRVPLYDIASHTVMPRTATKFHCRYNTTVSVRFMGSSYKHTTIILKESESWPITPSTIIMDQSTQVQSVCAIANCNLFLWGTAVNRGFCISTCATRPASLSRLEQCCLMLELHSPFCIHPILKCGTVSLLFCSKCPATSLSFCEVKDVSTSYLSLRKLD